ncbi:MAG: tetratricopeptide repeat protein [Lachnospiraceae bacterium]
MPVSVWCDVCDRFNGNGVEENSDEAFKWYRKAAEQGEPNAQFEIGQLYEFGAHDISTARQWYTKAAEQGHENAQQKLREL